MLSSTLAQKGSPRLKQSPFAATSRTVALLRRLLQLPSASAHWCRQRQRRVREITGTVVVMSGIRSATVRRARKVRDPDLAALALNNDSMPERANKTFRFLSTWSPRMLALQAKAVKDTMPGASCAEQIKSSDA